MTTQQLHPTAEAVYEVISDTPASVFGLKVRLLSVTTPVTAEEAGDLVKQRFVRNSVELALLALLRAERIKMTSKGFVRREL